MATLCDICHVRPATVWAEGAVLAFVFVTAAGGADNRRTDVSGGIQAYRGSRTPMACARRHRLGDLGRAPPRGQLAQAHG